MSPYAIGGIILQEDGFKIMLENGSYLLLEGTQVLARALGAATEYGIDFKFTYKEGEGYYDIGFQSGGDIEMVNSFDTAILMSLLTDKRADSSEVIQPERRRGWWGNTLADVEGYEVGSKLWLTMQSRKTQETINKMVDYVTDSFQWLVDDGYIQKLEVTGATVNGEIEIQVKFIREDDSINRPAQQYWEATTL